MNDRKTIIDFINFNLKEKIEYNFFESDKKINKNEIILYSYYINIINYYNFNHIYEYVNYSLLNNDKLFKNNDIFCFIINNFFANNLKYFSLFYCILFIKSFYNNNYIIKNYENSSIIVTKCSILFKNFLIFNDLNNSFNDNDFEINIFAHLFPIFESLDKFLQIKTVIIKSLDTYKTDKYWKLNNDINNDIDFNHFDIFLSKPLIKKYKNNYYLIGVCFFQVYQIFNKNVNSNITFKFYNEDYINNINNTEWHIDIEWYKEIIKIIKNYKNYDKINVDISIKEILIELEKNDWKNENLQKQYSNLIYYKNIFYYYEFIIKHEITYQIYFPFYFDFRGRMYYYGDISITNNKLLRTLYYQGNYNEDDYDKEVNEKLLELLKLYEMKLHTILGIINIHKTSPKINISIILLSISIGKFFIIKNQEKINIEKFIDYTILYLKNKNNLNELNDQIEISHYLKILYNIDNGRKYVVLKDFTASFFQHLIRLMGPKSRESLKLANMIDKYNWYDPYTHFINLFFKNNDLKYGDLFNRKTCKKVIMTVPYSIGKKSAWFYFIEKINTKYDEKRLKKEFNLFYSYIKKLLEDEIFLKNSTDKMLLYGLSKSNLFDNLLIEYDNSKTNLIYYKKKSKIIDLIISNDSIKKRITKKVNVISNEIDNNNIYRSLRANWIASMDADVLISINLKFKKPIYSVHDSLIIDWLNIDELIIKSNEILSNINFKNITWNNNHNFKIFSIMIIL
uniref:Uncharacterized protein n=1 Tax=Pseudourostyla cristata TaxID=293816 RepID=A0A4P9JLR2_9SPIT|nr:hypothetical protein [Pseudourostyla cristata]